MTAPRLTAHPRPGYFQMRLVKGGPFVAARIHRPCQCTVNGPAEHDWKNTCDRHRPLCATIDGKPADIWRVWTYGKEIDRADYEYLAGVADWSRTYAPEMPEANPRMRVDLNAIPSIF